MAIDNELEKRQQGLEFANRLSMLAAEAPDVPSELAVHDLAKKIRKRFTYSKDLRKKEIMAWLRRRSEHGGMSISELIEETGYYKNRICEALKELTAERKAEFRLVAPPGGKGGRPSARYFAATASFSQPKT